VKALEIHALARAIHRAELNLKSPLRILEVGCGNGYNCLELSKAFTNHAFVGVDYVPEMIQAANEAKGNAHMTDRVRFVEGNITSLGEMSALDSGYDVVFTDRCLINLNTTELQKAGLTQLCRKVRPGGFLLLIENFTTTYDSQNLCREIMGLPKRQPAEFNLFLYEEVVLPHIESCGLAIAEIEDFASLHDIVLYVLLPSLNNGVIDYNHPLVEAAARLSAGVSESTRSAFGQFGQNRLLFCHKNIDARDPRAPMPNGATEQS
jgi:ubiquinone/menaquinone biosynthesis C-methylase UbiE